MAKANHNNKPIELPKNNVAAKECRPDIDPHNDPTAQTSDVSETSEVLEPTPITSSSEDDIQIVVRKVPVAFGDLPKGANSKRLTIGTFKFDSIRQSQTFRRLREGLNRRSVRMANGRHIESQADVFRYLMEKLEADVV